MQSGVFYSGKARRRRTDVFSVIRNPPSVICHLMFRKPWLSSPKKALQENKQDVFQEELRYAQRYMLSVLPGTLGGMKAISVDYSAAMNMPDDAFS